MLAERIAILARRSGPHAALTLIALSCVATVCWSHSDPPLTREECERRFEVRIGREGKDVIWVPTHDKLVTAMLQAAEVRPGDFVIDLGAGDGRIAITAAKQFGARALGIEYDARMAELARCYVEVEGIASSVEIRQADLFETDLRAATVVTMYLTPKLNRKLRSTLLALQPGTRIVSNRFDLDTWRPDRVIAVEGHPNEALLWIVPERIAGTWQFENANGSETFLVRFKQRFQRVSASGSRISIDVVRLRGRTIELTLKTQQGAARLRGEITNDEMRLSNGDGLVYLARKQ